jgi:hypothetical protein
VSAPAKWSVVVTDNRDLFAEFPRTMVIGPFTSEDLAIEWARRINGLDNLRAEVCGMYPSRDPDLKAELVEWDSLPAGSDEGEGAS